MMNVIVIIPKNLKHRNVYNELIDKALHLYTNIIKLKSLFLRTT